VVVNVAGYGFTPRDVLPCSRKEFSVSAWSILKDAVGKGDIFRITVPIFFNEPVSMVQRMYEDVEYSSLLDRASECEDSLKRMVYVAFFAASAYTGTGAFRTAKPFNPLLGETFEGYHPDTGMRFICEQVRHHPPISACHAVSDNFEYTSDSAVKVRIFRSIEIVPLNFTRVTLRKHGPEHYSWKKVTSCVKNIIWGGLWFDQCEWTHCPAFRSRDHRRTIGDGMVALTLGAGSPDGTMEITNHNTNEVCELKMIPRDSSTKGPHRMEGKVYDADKNLRWVIEGTLEQELVARPVGEDGTPLKMDEAQAPTGSGSSSSSASSASEPAIA
jgi:oxysterol-binding protein 1